MVIEARQLVLVGMKIKYKVSRNLLSRIVGEIRRDHQITCL